MIALSYVSQATERFSQQQLVELLRVCHQNNEQKDITGLLLYNGHGTFVQTLEGDEVQVTQLYTVIKQDSRHRRVNQIGRKDLTRRIFPNWKMGFRNLSDMKIESLAGFSNFMDMDDPSDYLTSHQNFAFDLLAYFQNQSNELTF